MNTPYDGFVISDDTEKLQLDTIVRLLNTTYWAKNRPYETIRQSLEESLCFGVYLGDKQVAFARCVTDHTTVYWLCDVIVEEEYRNKGVASALIEYIVTSHKLENLMGILSSGHSKELYKRFGFRLSTNGFMLRSIPKR